MTDATAGKLGLANIELTLRSPEIRALIAITFLYPVVFCAVFFPTPANDLREHIALGLTFPIYTPNNPPMQTWIAGLVAAAGARDAWLFVLVAQCFNFIGLFYLVQTAKRFIGPPAAVPLVVLFCGSIYYSAAVPSMALNADQIQVPIWAGILYHALAAAQDNRWRDWLLAGILFGVACLTKFYSVIMLAALLLAAFSEPFYRKIFRNGRCYVAMLVSIPLIALYAILELKYGEAIAHAQTKFDLLNLIAGRISWNEFLFRRLDALFHLLRSFLLYGAPALVGLAIVAWRGTVSRPRMPGDPPRRFIVFAAAITIALLSLLILVGGLQYSTRYGYPFYGLCLLALLCLIEIKPLGFRDLAVSMLWVWAAIVVGTVVYSQVAINTVLREPAPAAAALLRELWDREFSCGPTYIIGDPQTARAITIYYRHSARAMGLGLPTDRINADERNRGGAIVIMTPDRLHPVLRNWFEGHTTATLELPYRRTMQERRHTYVYYFSAPRGCPKSSAGPSEGGPPAPTG